MTEDDHGGPPAFPSEQGETNEGSWNQTFNPGMTLRDFFAAHVIANPAIASADESTANIAGAAYAIADAMIAARKREAK